MALLSCATSGPRAQVVLTQPGCGALLSAPVKLFGINLNASAAELTAELLREAASSRLTARATADGIMNCVITWVDLDLGKAGGRYSSAPDLQEPRHMYTRAIKQRLHFVGYERRLSKGESVELELARSPASFSVSCASDARAERQGTLVRWPPANILSYHFPMIAEHPRNVKFERALLRAIRAHTRTHGRAPHVLDIGSGTGLLAMMAARGGARRVTSVEMVPAVCEVARQIVARNGYSDVIEVINVRSDDLTLYAMGGEPADILVSELIDDHVIGDGVLAAISDARKRLLTPHPLIVPRGGRMFLLPVSFRTTGPAGISLDELNTLRTDQLVLSHPYFHTKLTAFDPADYAVLGDPVEIFDFDWWQEVPGELAKGRTSAPRALTFSRGGIFNGPPPGGGGSSAAVGATAGGGAPKSPAPGASQGTVGTHRIHEPGLGPCHGRLPMCK